MILTKVHKCKQWATNLHANIYYDCQMKQDNQSKPKYGNVLPSTEQLIRMNLCINPMSSIFVPWYFQGIELGNLFLVSLHTVSAFIYHTICIATVPKGKDYSKKDTHTHTHTRARARAHAHAQLIQDCWNIPGIDVNNSTLHKIRIHYRPTVTPPTSSRPPMELEPTLQGSHLLWTVLVSSLCQFRLIFSDELNTPINGSSRSTACMVKHALYFITPQELHMYFGYCVQSFRLVCHMTKACYKLIDMKLIQFVPNIVE